MNNATTVAKRLLEQKAVPKVVGFCLAATAPDAFSATQRIAMKAHSDGSDNIIKPITDALYLPSKAIDVILPPDISIFAVDAFFVSLLKLPLKMMLVTKPHHFLHLLLHSIYPPVQSMNQYLHAHTSMKQKQFYICNF
jgi:hypothetical protein